MTDETANFPAIFQGTTIRRIWHEGYWWFSVVDVVGLLANRASTGPP
jgi:prophage antirepressor-like protein